MYNFKLEYDMDDFLCVILNVECDIANLEFLRQYTNINHKIRAAKLRIWISKINRFFDGVIMHEKVRDKNLPFKIDV